MSQLSEQQCEACSWDAPHVTEAEIEQYKAEIPEWQIIERDGIMKLERVFKFRNFKQALDFTNRVGEIAESEGHHPDIFLAWGRVDLKIWTHKIDGLTESDFVLAAKIDQLGAEGTE